METHHEVERTYDVGEDASVPRLTKLPKVATVESPRELELESVYFDTEDRDLLRAAVTLRRRTGGDDAGWHLKLPSGRGEREEIRQPLRRGAAASTVPRALRSLVQVHARGRTLVPVATVRNRRVVHRLLAKDDTALADFCDDNVTAEPTDGHGSSWREWEIELVQGPRKLLSAADELFGAAGARLSESGSKLVRAVGAPLPRSADEEQPEPSKRGPAGVVVLAHLRDQTETLKALDPQVRRDQPDAVHKMRVSTRRLRSALATFKQLLDPQRSEELSAELKWLAGVLGEARDAEVMRDRLTAAAPVAVGDSPPDEEPTRTVGHDGVASSLTNELDARYRTAHQQVLRVLDSKRYYRLLDALDDLLHSPPWTGAAEQPAREVLRTLVRRDWRRVEKRAAAAAHAATSEERDTELHELRKASKRLRYACEALTPVFGAPAASLGDAAKRLQEVLGEHQDSVVSKELLHELAEQAGLSAEVSLILGRLQMLEQEHAERSVGHYQAAWQEVSDKRLRRWLTS